MNKKYYYVICSVEKDDLCMSLPTDPYCPYLVELKNYQRKDTVLLFGYYSQLQKIANHFNRPNQYALKGITFSSNVSEIFAIDDLAERIEKSEPIFSPHKNAQPPKCVLVDITESITTQDLLKIIKKQFPHKGLDKINLSIKQNYNLNNKSGNCLELFESK